MSTQVTSENSTTISRIRQEHIIMIARHIAQPVSKRLEEVCRIQSTHNPSRSKSVTIMCFKIIYSKNKKNYRDTFECVC